MWREGIPSITISPCCSGYYPSGCWRKAVFAFAVRVWPHAVGTRWLPGKSPGKISWRGAVCFSGSALGSLSWGAVWRWPSIFGPPQVDRPPRCIFTIFQDCHWTGIILSQLYSTSARRGGKNGVHSSLQEILPYEIDLCCPRSACLGRCHRLHPSHAQAGESLAGHES
jgi:hypothetical protein